MQADKSYRKQRHTEKSCMNSKSYNKPFTNISSYKKYTVTASITTNLAETTGLLNNIPTTTSLATRSRLAYSHTYTTQRLTLCSSCCGQFKHHHYPLVFILIHCPTSLFRLHTYSRLLLYRGHFSNIPRKNICPRNTHPI